MDDNKTNLGTAPIGKLLVSLAIPSVCAQLVNVLYNMVDRIYIGHIPEIGATCLTALGVTAPILTLVSAFSALVCMGAAPKAAILMGKGDNEAAEKTMNASLFLLVLLGILLTGIVYFGSPVMLRMFGASDITYPYAISYIRIYALGTIFVQIAMGMNAFINTQGFAKFGMISVLIGAVCNIILDPIFIFILNLNVQGAALATIISQGISAIFVLSFLRGKRSILHIRKEYLHLDLKIILPCLLLGLAPFIMQSTESALSVCFNSSLLKYGGDMAVGTMTILHSVMMFAMMPLAGLTQGAQPIISFNYGAKKYDRIIEAFKLLLIVCVGYSALIWLVCVFRPVIFASLFTSNEALIEYAEFAMPIYMGACFMMGIQLSCQQTFVALGNAKTSLFLALLRKIILLIPLIYLLPLFFENKVFAVFLAEPVSDACAATVTAILFYRYFRKVLAAK